MFLGYHRLRYQRLLCSIAFAIVLMGFGSPLVAETTRVFILAGQSNMQGCGVVSFDNPKHYNGGRGNLIWAMKHSESRHKMVHLQNDSGFWKSREDVMIAYKHNGRTRKGPLTVGYTHFGGQTHFGPELQFGHVMGDATEDPVFIIKTAWGGKSLFADFRPPSAGGTVGTYYLQMIEEVREALETLDQPYQIEAFVWMQGWNDMIDPAATQEYADNLNHLIKDVREAFGLPDLPFVVGELGNDGTDCGQAIQSFRTEQRKGTQGATNSIFVETHQFARAPDDSPNPSHGHHWYGNAESYFLIGEALAQGYLNLSRSDSKAPLSPPNAISSTDNYRIFVSEDGARIEAELIEFTNDQVTLRRRDGKVFSQVPLTRFDPSTQAYLRSTQKSEPKEASSSDIKSGEVAGYGNIRTSRVDVEKYGGGFSLYSAVWPLVETYPGNRYQTGLLHTWMFAKYDPEIETSGMYSCIEGGLGWWRDTRFATETPKFIMGGLALKFSEWANGPGAGKGRSWEQPKGKYAIAQLISRVLWPPDGLNLKQGTSGKLFGYGYRPLPLVEAKETTYGHPVPTGDQCWTLFINTENVKGPLTFFLPEFFSRPSIEERKMAGQFLDTGPSKPNRPLSMETQHIPAFFAQDNKGHLYSRVATVLYPKTGADTVLAHQVIAYEKGPLWIAMENWFQHGEAPSKSAFAHNSKVQSFDGNGGSSWSIYPHGTKKEERYKINWDLFMKKEAFDEASFGYKWNEDYVSEYPYLDRTTYKLPEYYRLEPFRKSKIWVPVSADDVPAETGLHAVKFPKAGKRIMEPYLTPEEADSVWKSPGPISGPHTVNLGDGSKVTYHWYRFADQPSIQRSALSPDEREELQRRVELMHREWTLEQSFIPEPTVDAPLAMLDPALIVQPPKGYEFGYVPIVTRQEWAKKPRQ